MADIARALRLAAAADVRRSGKEERELKACTRQQLSDLREYRLRAIFRAFSERFHVPLPQVENDLPIIYVLRHHFEAQYADLKDEELDQEIHDLVETDEQKAARLAEEAAEAAKDEEFAAEVEREAAGQPTTPQPGPVRGTVDRARAVATLPEPKAPASFVVEFQSAADFEKDLG